MDTIVINSENRETSDPHRIELNLRDKMNLKRSYKYVVLSYVLPDDIIRTGLGEGKGAKLWTNIKCDFYKLPLIYAMKWKIGYWIFRWIF